MNKFVYGSIYGPDGRFGVLGPGNRFGYDAGTLWPELRLSSEKDSLAAAKLCNEAYGQGYQKAQEDIRKALGF